MQRSPKPGDASQRAWAVVREATHQAKHVPAIPKDPAAVARGRLGGLARAGRLTAARRSEIAKTAVAARRKARA
jgi:hypothetical protein